MSGGVTFNFQNIVTNLYYVRIVSRFLQEAQPGESTLSPGRKSLLRQQNVVQREEIFLHPHTGLYWQIRLCIHNFRLSEVSEYYRAETSC